MPGSVAELVELLQLEDLDVDLFRGQQPETSRQRVFGGQVAAQAVAAATRSVEAGMEMHSMHSYFLRPGDTAVPIIYDVERIRDGRSFVTRRVMARQHGRPIYFMTANFQVPEDGLDHQDRMPDVPPPEMGVSMTDIARQNSPESVEEWEREWAALDVRYVGTSAMGLPADPDHPARAQLWLRTAGPLGDDPVAAPRRLHLCHRPDAARRGPDAARHPHQLLADEGRLARPLDLVPPALPGRRVVALRPGLADGARRSRPGHRARLHPGRHARGDRGPGGPDPGRRPPRSLQG